MGFTNKEVGDELEIEITIDDDKHSSVILQSLLNNQDWKDTMYSDNSEGIININILSSVDHSGTGETNRTFNGSVYLEGVEGIEPYDNIGALSFVIVVIVVYGISMFLLLGTLARRKYMAISKHDLPGNPLLQNKYIVDVIIFV